MKTKLILVFGAFLLIGGIEIWNARRDSGLGPDAEVRPSGATHDEAPARTLVGPLPPEQSPMNNPAGAGMLTPGSVAGMERVEKHMAGVLASAVDEATGKGSVWYPKLVAWHEGLRKAVQTKRRDDLFELVPVAAEFYQRDREADPLAGPLDDLRFWMGHLGYSLITELATVVAENDGTLDDRTANLAVMIFSVKGMQSDPWPEDEIPPLDSAGIVIARPDVVPLLETLPPGQLSFFLGAQTAERFFRRYEEGGDGMPVLRDRYRKNREALRESFAGMARKVAADQAGTRAE